ncbi:MAG: hypothetical protein COB12_11585 [Flavobacterium sp.]|nr:MAG: hypothetical protein COB12_11585 [Flavobacterium sp.]
MKNNKVLLIFILLFTSLLFVQCKDDDDNGNVIDQETCDDGIQNGEETGIDCGGTICLPCEEGGTNFDGIFVQEDALGRPAVNMIFGGSDTMKNEYNITEVSNHSSFQTSFLDQLENYHDIYAIALEIPVEDLNYETNIFNWNAEKFTTIMSNFDALQVAPNGNTTYYNENSNLVFTGRKLSDDVMDVTLMLMFGGADGTRFDGNNDTPQLTTDGVDAGDRDFSLPFPYLESPINE